MKQVMRVDLFTSSSLSISLSPSLSLLTLSFSPPSLLSSLSFSLLSILSLFSISFLSLFSLSRLSFFPSLSLQVQGAGFQLAERLGNWAINQEVASSIPGRAKLCCVLGQGTSPYLPRGECPCTYCKSLWIRASAK